MSNIRDPEDASSVTGLSIEPCAAKLKAGIALARSWGGKVQEIFHQAGWCGIMIAVLAAAAAYAVVRGEALVIMRRRGRWLEGGRAREIAKAVQGVPEGRRELALGAMLRSEFSDISGCAGFLKLCAALGPLLGLMGTVLGMVDVFEAISMGSSSVNPAELAGGIWKALLTTVMGLALAIPSMVAAWLIQSQLRQVRTALMLGILAPVDARGA